MGCQPQPTLGPGAGLLCELGEKLRPSTFAAMDLGIGLVDLQEGLGQRCVVPGGACRKP